MTKCRKRRSADPTFFRKEKEKNRRKRKSSTTKKGEEGVRVVPPGVYQRIPPTLGTGKGN